MKNNIKRNYIRVFYVKFPMQKYYIYKIRCWIKDTTNMEIFPAFVQTFIEKETFIEVGRIVSEEELIDRIVEVFNNELAAIEILNNNDEGVICYLD